MAPVNSENFHKRNKKSKQKLKRLQKKTKDFKPGIQKQQLNNVKGDIQKFSFEGKPNTQSFKSLTSIVSFNTMRAIEAMGFTNMTDIQFKCIPKLLVGKDLRGTAKTGSGKTLAFLIPAIELMVRLKYEPKHGTGVIILSPTRELAMQIFQVLTQLIKYHSQTVGLLVGGTNINLEISKLAKGINILVATPGRLLDHMLDTPQFNFKNLVCVVIDEADRMFDAGFEKDMKKIINLIPKQRQTMLFSATHDKKTDELAKLVLQSNLIEVDVDTGKRKATCEGLAEAYVVCPADKRFLTLFSFLKNNNDKKVMVFFSTCKCVKLYEKLLNHLFISVLCIHGQQSQAKRTSSFNEFSKAKSGILLCTDVAARGWDIPAVDWIVQYDPPADPKEYLHRVGRTARAGGVGNAVLFLTEEEIGFVAYLKSQKINLNSMAITRYADDYQQQQLRNLLIEDDKLHQVAMNACTSFLIYYKSHSLKNVFKFADLNLDKVAKCFGLKVAPIVPGIKSQELKPSFTGKKSKGSRITGNFREPSTKIRKKKLKKSNFRI